MSRVVGLKVPIYTCLENTSLLWNIPLSPYVSPCSACTPPIPLYSLVPITPYCSVANRRVTQVASYWLANSVRPVPTRPVQLFPFRFGVRARPSGPGSDWRAQLVRRDLVSWIFWCSDRGLLLRQFGIGER